MTEFWLGVLAGGITVWALGTLTILAIRGAEHGVPMAGGHWDPDQHDPDLDREIRDLLDQDSGR